MNDTYLMQLQKLQSLLANGAKRKAQTGTCLAVMLFSVCLLVAPNLSSLRGQKQDVDEEALALQASANENNKHTPLAGMIYMIFHSNESFFFRDREAAYG